MLNQKKHLLSIFKLQNHPEIPPDLAFLILELSGLVKVGRHGCVFTVHIPRFIKYLKPKKKKVESK